MTYCAECGQDFLSKFEKGKFCGDKCRQRKRARVLLRARIKSEGYEGFRVSQLRKAGYEVIINEKP